MKTKTSRRSFLKSALAVGTGVVAAAPLKRLSRRRNVRRWRIDGCIIRLVHAHIAKWPGRASGSHWSYSKTKGRRCPLSKRLKRIHVAGKCANDIGNQCGGWTIDWQGRSGTVTTGGTTILGAIQKAVSSSTRGTFSVDGAGAKDADVGIVVIGETPYAEGRGDREDLSLSNEGMSAIMNLRNAGLTVVVVLVSGRPMIINEALNQANAFVAAWLLGTEGQGVADVLFGDYQPTGKLSCSWPRAMSQIPINIGDANYDPLFRYGYGLTYS